MQLTCVRLQQQPVTDTVTDTTVLAKRKILGILRQGNERVGCMTGTSDNAERLGVKLCNLMPFTAFGKLWDNLVLEPPVL